MGNTCRGQQQQAAHGTSSPNRGCTIPKAEYRGITLGRLKLLRTKPPPEHRGITLWQLKDIVKEIKKRCKKEGWTSTNPDDNGKLLEPEEVTLYDLVKHYIIPETASRKCSYVELVATGEQKPKWFVSHWWGERVFDFVECIEQHAWDRRRRFINDGISYCDQRHKTYWVCAYALNQHNATDEIGDGDPTHSPFYRAMQLTDGMVSVLDKDAVCYSRIWCAFEVYIAFKDITEQREAVVDREKYLYDVYTFAPHTYLGAERTAVGLTDGLGVDGKAIEKGEREKHFPLELCQAALTIQLENAKASIEKDRWRILNWIVHKGHCNPNAEPPLTHPSYNEVNAFLRGKFATAAYPHAVEVGKGIELYRSALKAMPFDTLGISFSMCDAFRNEALHFANALPASLTKLDLDLGDIKFESCNEFAIGFSRLSNLVSFKLTLLECQELTDLKDLWNELKDLDSLKELKLVAPYCYKLEHLSEVDEKLVPLPKNLTTLDLDFYSCNLLSLDGLSIGLRQLHRLSTLWLNLSWNSAITSIDKLGQAIAHLACLESLRLNFNGCEKLSSLVELAKGLNSLKRLSKLMLYFVRSDLTSVDGLGKAISGLELLTELLLDFSHCTKVDSFSPFAHATRPLHRLSEVSLWFKGDCSCRLMKVKLSLEGDCSWDENDSRVLCHNLSELPNLQRLWLILPSEIREFYSDDRDKIDKFLRDRLAMYES